MKPWIPISEPEVVWQKFFRRITRIDFRLPDGRVADFYLTELGGRAGSVLALTPEREVILTRQFRPGPGEVLWDPPGGAIEAGEDPMAAVARELREETGYEGKLHPAGELWHEAYSGVRKFAFVATDCRLVGPPKLDDHEFIDVELVPLARAREIFFSGAHTTPEIFLALRFLDEHPELLG